MAYVEGSPGTRSGDPRMIYYTKTVVPGASAPCEFWGETQEAAEGSMLLWLLGDKHDGPALRRDQIRWTYEPAHPPAKLFYQGARTMNA